MKIVKELTGSNRLPNEFVLINNLENSNVTIPENSKMMIAFLESYDGHYVDDMCEWVIAEK